MEETLGWEDPMQEEMATHSSIFFFNLNLFILIGG